MVYIPCPGVARLAGYADPITLASISPDGTKESRFERLYRVRDRGTGEPAVNHLTLEAIAACVGGAVAGNVHPQTENGYTWRAALYFKVNGGELAMLFPHIDHMEEDPELRILVYQRKLDSNHLRQFGARFAGAAQKVIKKL